MEDFKIEILSFVGACGKPFFFGEVLNQKLDVFQFISDTYTEKEKALQACEDFVKSKSPVILHLERVTDFEKRLDWGGFTISVYTVLLSHGKYEYFGDVRRKGSPYQAIFTSGMFTTEESAADDCRLWAETQEKDDTMKMIRTGAVYSLELLLVVAVLLSISAIGLVSLGSVVKKEFKATENDIRDFRKNLSGPVDARKEEEVKIQNVISRTP